MKKISIKSTNSKVSFEKFKGVDTRGSHRGAPSTEEIVNFRILADGSLEKREGYSLLCSLDAPIRAVWTGKINGQPKCIALSGDTVYSVDTQNGSTQVIATVNSSEGAADFFYYRGYVYLVDGIQIYCIYSRSAKTPLGYVPLIGKEWSDNQIGEIYEPRNLLNPHGRITYRISEKATSILRLNAPANRVEAVYINGENVSPSRYTLTNSPPAINVTGLSPFDFVEVIFTYADNYEDEDASSSLDALLKSTRAIVFGGINNSRPFLFGSEDASVMFSSAYVSDESLKASQFAYPESDALYFPAGYEFTVGDGRYPISAVSRHYDRLLIFTEGGAWMADSGACGTEEFPIMNINSSIGATAPSAVTVGNSPCTVGVDGVYLWRAETDELDDCNAYCISYEINSYLPKEFFESAQIFADTLRGELLFAFPNADGVVWVYNAQMQGWSCFEGIFAEKFFSTYDRRLCFIAGSRLYAFDRANYLDEGERKIVGRLSTGIIDFGSDEKKHMSALGLCTDGGSAKLTLSYDGDESNASVVSIQAPDAHTYVKKRISSKRFKYLRLKLCADGDTRQRIHSIYLKTR